MKLLSTTFKTLVAPTVLALSLGMQTSAFAGESKEYVGSTCLPGYETHSDKNWNRLNARFNAEGTISVRCPMVRDKTTNTNGIDYAYVRIYRKPGNPSPKCWFWNHDKYGSNYIGDSYGSFPLGYSFRKFDISSSYNRGGYSWWCSLRQGDKVTSYKLREN